MVGSLSFFFSSPGLYAAMARVLLAAGTAGLTGEVEKCQGFEALLQAIEEYPENPAVIKEVNRALQGLSVADQNMTARAVKEAVPKLCAEASSAIQTDPECADTFCELMMQLVSTEGNGRQLHDVYGLEETLQGIENLGDYYGDDFGRQLKEKVAMIRQAMEDDQPREKTCKDVFELLNNRAAQGLSVAVNEVAILQEEAEFLFTQMAMYNQEQLDHQTAMGADHQYGNMAFEILASNVSNVKLLQSNDFAKMEFSLIKGQKDEEIVLYAVKALVAFCKHPPAAQDSARIPGCPQIVTDACARINNNKKMGNERAEEQLCARYFLVERTAVNRNLYNKTPIMTELIRTWDDYDKGQYTTTLLRSVTAPPSLVFFLVCPVLSFSRLRSPCGFLSWVSFFACLSRLGNVLPSWLSFSHYRAPCLHALLSGRLEGLCSSPFLSRLPTVPARVKRKAFLARVGCLTVCVYLADLFRGALLSVPSCLYMNHSVQVPVSLQRCG